jgi:hypothetical protein
VSEDEHAEVRRLEHERHRSFGGERATEPLPGDRREGREVRPELEFEHDSGHGADDETDGEDFGQSRPSCSYICGSPRISVQVT